MTHSGRERHRDRSSRRREIEEEPPSPTRTFRLTDLERRKIARCLQYIDEARRTLEDQHNSGNREIVRELRASADEIFELIANLEESGS
jgi:hypothetical protein